MFFKAETEFAFLELQAEEIDVLRHWDKKIAFFLVVQTFALVLTYRMFIHTHIFTKWAGGEMQKRKDR
jgi:hypothetical protein